MLLIKRKLKTSFLAIIGTVMHTFASSVILATTRLSRVVGEDLLHQLVGTLLELIDDSVVQGILVLLQPAGNVVRHLGGSQKAVITWLWQLF